MGKKSKGFNTPFEELEALRLKLVLEEKERAAAEKKRVAAEKAAEKERAAADKDRAAGRYDRAYPASSAASSAASGPPRRDEEVFADEMRGVAPLEPDPRGRVIGGAAPPPSAPRRKLDDESEAYAELADLVEGAGVFDITATDEYVEGIGPGIDKRLLRKLRAGDYAVQAHLDLHGFTSEEARPEVEKFLDAARKDSRRCVLIIHGRGHNSKEGIAVLKERLKVWLTRGRISRGVLAFCTARPTDGGAGAVYVLLRK